MDFWDITKLLVRRWMIVLPLLVLSGALAIGAMSQVKPDYVATAYVQLVPPVTGDTKPGEATIDQRNPWIGLGLQTIGNAAIVTVTDLSFGEQLHANGFSSSYTVTMAQSSPLVTFEIVGTSKDQAKRTAEQLTNRFNQSVGGLQTSYGVSKADLIISRRLDVGTNVKKSTSKVKRALVAVAGAGVLLTIAATVAIDAWLRRRQRQRAGAGPALATPTPQASTATAYTNGGRRPEPDLVTMAISVNGSGNGAPVTRVKPAAGRDGEPAASDAELTQPINLQISVASTEAEREADREPAIGADATIVLPRFRPQPVARPRERE